ncbi:hypothetical protein HanPI659440_Chr13g0494011 [Helianthus annuus]|nr:hypothetical protein HanPI659440_Chr13g0494011 [Helianthus annuus]
MMDRYMDIEVVFFRHLLKFLSPMVMFRLQVDIIVWNVQLLKDELKSYACRQDLLYLGESTKELFEMYGIPEVRSKHRRLHWEVLHGTEEMRCHVIDRI